MLEPNLANHAAQRVGIFIDTQNLYHSAKSNYRSNVNYEEVIRSAVNGRRLVRAFAYVIKSENTDEEKFFDALADIGIEIRVKDIQVFYTGEKKADWDVGIAVDMIRMTEKLDTVVLVSGDGDFIEVIKYVKSRGVRAEIMAFKKTTSLKLVEEADFFYDLGSEPERFLINPRGVRKVAPAKRLIAQHKVPADSGESSASQFKKTQNAMLTKNIEQNVKNAPAYSSSSFYLKKNHTSSKLDESIYGKKTNRNIKPVVGLPVKKTIHPDLIAKQRQNKEVSLENVFGNKKPMRPTPKVQKPMSNIFKNF